MRETMVSYFAGEKAQGWFWLSVGIVMALHGAVLLLRGGSLRAMGWPLVIVALVQVGVGIWLLTGSDARAAGAFDAAAELQRMRGVMRSFAIIEVVELVLLAAAVVVTLVARRRETLFAVACGLIVQCAAMYVLDLVAEKRGARYVAALEHRP